MIVLFIIGSHKEPSTGYSRKNAEFPVILNRRSKVYIVNPTVDTGSSVERMADGDQKQQVVHSARRMEAMSLDHHQEGPFDETTLDVDEIEVKGTTGL